MKFAREAWPFVLPFWVAAGIAVALGHSSLGAALAVLGLAVLLFFRDPARSFEGDASVVLAPADGLVTGVELLEEPSVGEGRFQRIVTFLSAFDVHVQRVSADGKVVTSRLQRGRKVAAFREDAGEVNEAYLTVLERSGSDGDSFIGDRLGIRQISGLMARRVVCYLEEGQEVRRGQHLGLIKFGSRVDLYVPEGYEVLVQKGDRLKNGATPVARPPSP